jgi:hypothetical protein
MQTRSNSSIRRGIELPLMSYASANLFSDFSPGFFAAIRTDTFPSS